MDERIKRKNVEKTRALLSKVSLDNRIWAEAVHYAVFIQNLLLSGNSSFSITELLTGIKPGVD